MLSILSCIWTPISVVGQHYGDWIYAILFLIFRRDRAW